MTGSAQRGGTLVNVTMTLRPRRGPECDTPAVVAVADCVAVVRQARAAPGCLDFCITTDLLEADRVNVYERWESDADVEQFRGSGQDAGQTAQIHAADVCRYRISAVEDA